MTVKTHESVVSLNVEGLYNIEKAAFLSWLTSTNASVICLQNTKATAQEMEGSVFDLPGYLRYSVAGLMPSLGGTLIFCKATPKAILTFTGFESSDRHGRFLQVDFDAYSVVSMCLPHHQDLNAEVQEEFMSEFSTFLAKQNRKRRQYVYCCSLASSPNTGSQITFGETWLEDITATLGYLATTSNSQGYTHWMMDKPIISCHLISPSLQDALVITKADLRFSEYSDHPSLWTAFTF